MVVSLVMKSGLVDAGDSHRHNTARLLAGAKTIATPLELIHLGQKDDH